MLVSYRSLAYVATASKEKKLVKRVLIAIASAALVTVLPFG